MAEIIEFPKANHSENSAEQNPSAETVSFDETLTIRLPRRSRKHQVAVACPVRTPIGRFGGGLSSLTAVELGAVAARGPMRRAGLEPDRIDLALSARASGVWSVISRGRRRCSPAGAEEPTVGKRG